MSKQHRRLQSILDGFLLGDLELIERSSAEFADAMGEITRIYKAAPEKRGAYWRAVSEIIEQASKLEQATGRGDYPKAYGYFKSWRLPGECVQCH